jgi:OOP family OmpA-OmpF porin
MRNTFTPKYAALAVFCALALGALSAPASAQVGSEEKSLLTDSRGAPIMNGFGECWHGGFGPTPQWTRGCHADAPKPVALYVAPVAAAAPAAAPAPVYEKVAFDANILFDSNKSSLRPAGTEKLDEFVLKIAGLESRSVMAVGYADRMGTESSNQALSEARVNAVKAYLVTKGVADTRVRTSAWGEMRPTTYNAECKDANNAKNVACMQPDRHVFIEVSGTRLAQ